MQEPTRGKVKAYGGKVGRMKERKDAMDSFQMAHGCN